VTIDADRAAAFEQLAAYYRMYFPAGLRVRHSARRIDQCEKAAPIFRLFLVDFMGGEHGAAGIGNDLHEQLAA